MSATQSQPAEHEEEPRPQEEISLEHLFPEDATCLLCALDEDAIAYCRQCKRLLCDECLTYHRRMVDTREHEILDSPRAEEVRKLYHCSTHTDKTLDYFCKNCNVAICQHCYVTACKEHEVEVSTNARDEVKGYLDRAKENRDRFVSHAEHIDSVMAQNEQAFNKCEGGVRQAFDGLIKELEDKREVILTQLRIETERNKEKVELQQEFVRNAIVEMKKTIESAENLLKTKKDAKLMVNKVRTSSDLDGRSQQKWNRQNATFREWQLDHKPQPDYAEKFSLLIPRPQKEDLVVEGITEARVGVPNTFTVTANIADQLLAFDATTIKNFLSVKILFSAANERASTNISRTVTREDNVWTVSYILRQQGTVQIYASFCEIQLEGQPFTLTTNPSKKEIKVGDRVVRGVDWKWENQDGGEGSKGTVVGVKKTGWVNVKWDRNVKHDYRWGAQDSYDLKVVADD